MNHTGKIMRTIGTEFNPPEVVYVKDWAGQKPLAGLYAVVTLNKNEIGFVKENELLEFEYESFKIAYYQWYIENTEAIQKRYQKLITEIKNKS